MRTGMTGALMVLITARQDEAARRSPVSGSSTVDRRAIRIPPGGTRPLLEFGLARHEDVAPAVARAVAVEHVHPISFCDLEPRRKHLQPTRAPTTVARDEQAVTGFEDGLVALVVPVGR